MHRIFTLGILIVFVVVLAYITSRSAAESSLGPLRMKPTPTPTKNPYYIPNLGKALSNQGVQIWAMQTEIKALQSQARSQQAAIARLQGQVSSLSSQVSSLSSQVSSLSSQAYTQFLRLNTWFQPGLLPGSTEWGDLKKTINTNQYDNAWIPVMIRVGQ